MQTVTFCYHILQLPLALRKRSFFTSTLNMCDNCNSPSFSNNVLYTTIDDLQPATENNV